MRTLLPVIFLALLSLAVKAQDKMILERGTVREVIKKGDVVGVTLNGERDRFKGWRTAFKCSDAVRQNLWIIDSIGADRIFLSGYTYRISYRYDTLLAKDVRKIKQSNYVLDTVLPDARGRRRFDKCVFKILSYERVGTKYANYRYDSIESFTFTKLDMKRFLNHSGKGHASNRFFNMPNLSGQDAFMVVLVVLSVELTALITVSIVDTIKAEVHTCRLNDWKVKMKINKKVVYYRRK